MQGRTKEDAGGERIRLISWNLHGPVFGSTRRAERMSAAGSEILRRLPDVVLLQEVWLSRDYDRMVKQLSGTYTPVDMPKRGFLMREGGLLAFVRRSSQWHARSSDFRRFEAEAPEWRIWEGDGLGNKGVQRIDLVREDVALVVLNTHLQAQYWSSDWVGVRRRQIEELRRVAAEVDSKIPLIAAGDLNTSPREGLYANLTRFWQDLTAEAREECDCGTQVGDNGGRGEWIDYFLARKGRAWRIEATTVELIRSTRPDHPYSDHHGLDTTIRLTWATETRLSAAALALQRVRGPSTRREWLLSLAYLAPFWRDVTYSKPDRLG